VARTGRSHVRWFAAIVAAALVAGGCSDFFGKPDEPADAGAQEVVAPDYTSNPVVVNISLSDDGFEPETVFLPAGRRAKLILRNRGRGEYHFRVVGLIPAEMSWVMVPEIDAYDVDSMSPEDLEALGLTGDIDDIDHVLHHLTPVYVPFRETSPAGIKPLANEVHGYVTQGKTDVLDFFPTNVGSFVVEDVLHPGTTGKVVVFDPSESDPGATQ
jgi:hypothetical protein